MIITGFRAAVRHPKLWWHQRQTLRKLGRIFGELEDAARASGKRPLLPQGIR